MVSAALGAVLCWYAGQSQRDALVITVLDSEYIGMWCPNSSARVLVAASTRMQCWHAPETYQNHTCRHGIRHIPSAASSVSRALRRLYVLAPRCPGGCRPAVPSTSPQQAPSTGNLHDSHYPNMHSTPASSGSIATSCLDSIARPTSVSNWDAPFGPVVLPLPGSH